MKNIQIKKKKTPFLKNPIVLLILFVLLVFFVLGVVDLFFRMQDTIKNKKISENQLKTLEDRKSKLIEDIDALNSEKGKEKVFRENYGYANEGEGVIFIVANQELNSENITQNTSFLEKIKNFFSF